MDNQTKIESLLKSKPELLEGFSKYLESEKKKVRHSNTVQHGKTLQVVPAEPITVSLKEAKRIMKANKPPRKPVSEEQRKRMIENLAKGRETIRKRREANNQQVPASSGVQIQVKAKSIKSSAPKVQNKIQEEMPALEVDPDFEEFKMLKRKQAALQALQSAKQPKKSKLSPFYN
jgi:hypothetical protein